DLARAAGRGGRACQLAACRLNLLNPCSQGSTKPMPARHLRLALVGGRLNEVLNLLNPRGSLRRVDLRLDGREVASLTGQKRTWSFAYLTSAPTVCVVNPSRMLQGRFS